MLSCTASSSLEPHQTTFYLPYWPILLSFFFLWPRFESIAVVGFIHTCKPLATLLPHRLLLTPVRGSLSATFLILFFRPRWCHAVLELSPHLSFCFSLPFPTHCSLPSPSVTSHSLIHSLILLSFTQDKFRFDKTFLPLLFYPYVYVVRRTHASLHVAMLGCVSRGHAAKAFEDGPPLSSGELHVVRFRPPPPFPVPSPFPPLFPPFPRPPVPQFSSALFCFQAHKMLPSRYVQLPNPKYSSLLGLSLQWTQEFGPNI